MTTRDGSFSKIAMSNYMDTVVKAYIAFLRADGQRGLEITFTTRETIISRESSGHTYSFSIINGDRDFAAVCVAITDEHSTSTNVYMPNGTQPTTDVIRYHVESMREGEHVRDHFNHISPVREDAEPKAESPSNALAALRGRVLHEYMSTGFFEEAGELLVTNDGLPVHVQDSRGVIRLCVREFTSCTPPFVEAVIGGMSRHYFLDRPIDRSEVARHVRNVGKYARMVGHPTQRGIPASVLGGGHHRARVMDELGRSIPDPFAVISNGFEECVDTTGRPCLMVDLSDDEPPVSHRFPDQGETHEEWTARKTAELEARFSASIRNTLREWPTHQGQPMTIHTQVDQGVFVLTLKGADRE